MSKKAFIAAFAFLLVLACTILVRNAWLGDDSFITFRTVDNIVHGYGPVWNPGVRVQTFTHPLWMLTICLVYFFTGEIFFSVILLSILITLTTLALYSLKIAVDYKAAILGFILLILSKAFIDYSTSGLENPLSHLILAVWFYCYMKPSKDYRSILVLSTIASLGILTRMDTALIYGPALVQLYFSRPTPKSVYYLLLGMTPFILWECFSLFYYGFAFPNTAYAKLNTGIESWMLMYQGLMYLINATYKGIATVALIVIAIVIPFIKRQTKLIPIAAGIFLYLLYVIKVGGDFMTGRFITVPFMASVLLLSQVKFDFDSKRFRLFAGVLLLAGIYWPRSPLWTGKDFGIGDERLDWDHAISDERAAYFQASSLLNTPKGGELPYHEWAELGREYRKIGDTLVQTGPIGFIGYCAGPEVYVLGAHALDDPLLARLPVARKTGWRIGHFRRIVPEGYVKTLRTGINCIKNQSLAEYYDKLHMITSGGLFSWGRIIETFKMNLGTYDYLIDRYLSSPEINVRIDKINNPKASGTAFDSRGCYVLSETGIGISFGEMCNNAAFEVSLDHNDSYVIHYMIDSLVIDSQIVEARWTKLGGLRVDTVEVVETVRQTGFNAITIVPVVGDGRYSVGHVRLLDTSITVDDWKD